jgi:hypothetical protein
LSIESSGAIFFHLKRSAKAFGLQVTRSYRKPNYFALSKHTVAILARKRQMFFLKYLENTGSKRQAPFVSWSVILVGLICWDVNFVRWVRSSTELPL